MANTTQHFRTVDCNTKGPLVLAAKLRSGAGRHSSGPRRGQTNFVRDILDEYYAENAAESGAA